MSIPSPLTGIRVLEIGAWNAVPSAGALMADLGADVIKVEPPEGDAFRGFQMRLAGYDHDFETNYIFQLDNRGKRSLTVALDRPGGPELIRRLCREVDVFVVNLLARRRERFGLTWEDLRVVNPRLVCVSFTGYGLRNPDADRPGFDYAAFWARSGLMSVIGEPPSPPPICRGGQGDHTTSLNLLAAVFAALRLRDLTGEGQHVEVTLQRTGVWTLGSDIQSALVAKQQPPRHDRTVPANPLWNTYQASDGRWILLAMPRPDPDYWPAFCRAVERDDWLADPGLATIAGRRAATGELTAAIGAIFAARDSAYWAARLDEFRLIWAPVATLPEVVEDPQLRAMGAFETIDHPVHGPFETLSVPFSIEGVMIHARGPAPEVGEHNASVLADLGLSEGEIDRLVLDGVLG